MALPLEILRARFNADTPNGLLTAFAVDVNDQPMTAFNARYANLDADMRLECLDFSSTVFLDLAYRKFVRVDDDWNFWLESMPRPPPPHLNGNGNGNEQAAAADDHDQAAVAADPAVGAEGAAASADPAAVAAEEVGGATADPAGLADLYQRTMTVGFFISWQIEKVPADAYPLPLFAG